jgi:hypothetical protein
MPQALVIPAHAGIHPRSAALDPGVRRDDKSGRTLRLGIAASCLGIGVLLTGCAISDARKIDAITSVNQGFRVEYEKVLAERGTRIYPVPVRDAFTAMRVTLAGLGMATERQDLALGYLAVAGAAPLPLTDVEWQAAAQADLPLLRRLIEPHVGMAASFVQFEPQGLDVVISATFAEVARGTEVSMTVRLRETAAPRSGWPRREYVLPTAVRTGLDKIHTRFERELRAGPQRP